MLVLLLFFVPVGLVCIEKSHLCQVSASTWAMRFLLELSVDLVAHLLVLPVLLCAAMSPSGEGDVLRQRAARGAQREVHLPQASTRGVEGHHVNRRTEVNHPETIRLKESIPRSRCVGTRFRLGHRPRSIATRPAPIKLFPLECHALSVHQTTHCSIMIKFKIQLKRARAPGPAL
jgi:hypothetical protein